MLKEYSSEIEIFDSFLRSYMKDQFWSNKELQKKSRSALNRLQDSVEYSLFSGGKRFRPVLSLLVAKNFNQDYQKYLGFAAAVEFIHTYSLIHDDLPCMDNDDERRGIPTNHKKFDEATALLAGDSLLTEAFHIITEMYSEEPKLCVELCSLLTKAVGFCGMIGGQVLDIDVLKAGCVDASLIEDIHHLKTAALITVSIEGAAVISGCSSEQRDKLKNYGKLIGEAFQVADDILDFDEKAKESSSYVSLHGMEKSRAHLNELSQKCLVNIKEFNSSDLEHLVHFNHKRTH